MTRESDIDAWFYADGAVPEHLRSFVDELRDDDELREDALREDALDELPPSTLEDIEPTTRRHFEKLDAELSQQEEPSLATSATSATTATSAATATRSTLATAATLEAPRWVSDEGLTVRSPQLQERPAAPAPPPEPIARSLPAEEPRPPGPRPRNPLATRSLALDIPPELRVQQDRAPSEPRPPEPRPPNLLAITMPAVDIAPELREQQGGLPFEPRAPGNELAWTMQVPVYNLLKGQTAPIDHDMIEMAGAALPFPGSTAGAAIIPIPRLTLNEYASLRAELSVSPERSTAIRRQYQVMNGAALGALEEHWQRELAASPEARATFEEALASYTAYLRAQKG